MIEYLEYDDESYADNACIEDDDATDFDPLRSDGGDESESDNGEEYIDKEDDDDEKEYDDDNDEEVERDESEEESEDDEEVESDGTGSLSSRSSVLSVDSGTDNSRRKRMRTSKPLSPATLRERVEFLESENEALRKSVCQLKAQLAVRTTTRRPHMESAAPPTVAGPGPRLKLLVQGSSDSDLHKVHPPHRFSSVGAFPHAVVLNEGERQYQVEARRPATLVYGLVNDDGTPATSNYIGVDEMLFKLSIHYADTDREVSPNDFNKGRIVDSLVSPSSALTLPKRLVNGCITIRVNFMFSSINTLGTKNRPVIVRLQPADPKYRTNPRLKVDSFPFMVRGKVTALRR